MIREPIARQLDHDPNFQWRGKAVTRIENLSDIVFALALGMLVSASTPPQTFDQLIPHLKTIIPVAAGFIFMVMIWNHHFTFFRRYGVADAAIIALNAALLLFILFIAYPLRFAFDSLYAFILQLFGSNEMMESLGIRTYRQAGEIIAWLNVGLAVIYSLFHWMYAHALSKAEVLDLTPSEAAITRRSIWRYRGEVVIAIVVAWLAMFTLAGPFSAILGILNWPIAAITERRIKLHREVAESQA